MPTHQQKTVGSTPTGKGTLTVPNDLPDLDSSSGFSSSCGSSSEEDEDDDSLEKPVAGAGVSDVAGEKKKDGNVRVKKGSGQRKDADQVSKNDVPSGGGKLLASSSKDSGSGDSSSKEHLKGPSSKRHDAAKHRVKRRASGSVKSFLYNNFFRPVVHRVSVSLIGY